MLHFKMNIEKVFHVENTDVTIPFQYGIKILNSFLNIPNTIIGINS